MKNIYCIVCGKYKKIKNPKISYILEQELVLSIIYIKCGSKEEKILKEEESIKIFEICKILNYTEHLLPYFLQLLCVFQFLFVVFSWYSCRYCNFCNNNKIFIF